MYVGAELLCSIVALICINGLFCSKPEHKKEPQPHEDEYMTSSEALERDCQKIEEDVRKITLPGTVAAILANYTVINTDGWRDRLKMVQEWRRNVNKKWYNNETKRFESFYQKVAKIQDQMEEEMFKEGLRGKSIEAYERALNDAEVERYLANHPNVTFIPDLHAITDDEPEYSGDVIKDDYEVRRKKRSINENKIQVSNDNDMENLKLKKLGERKKRNVVSLNKDRKNIRKNIIKNTRINKRELSKQEDILSQDALESLKYLVLKTEISHSMDLKHVVKRDADEEIDARGGRYADYKSDLPYSKYVSGAHIDAIVPELRRKKVPSDFNKKRHTPEDSIYVDGGSVSFNPEAVKKKELYRDMEYWTFTHPINKYTSESTKMYDKPMPTMAKKAATISVGASRYKLFNKNWYNYYKHRINKRDVFGGDINVGHYFQSAYNFMSKVKDVYSTLMTIYYKSVYHTLIDMYCNSYFGPCEFLNSTDNIDPDYIDALDHWQNLTRMNFSDSTNATITEGYEKQTTYIYLNWYTEKYKDNTTQYFCSSENNTYMLVNKRLKLYNKTYHHLVEDLVESNITSNIAKDTLLIDTRTKEPPILQLVSEEQAKRVINNTSKNDEKYILVKNLSNPYDLSEGSLKDIYAKLKNPVEQQKNEVQNINSSINVMSDSSKNTVNFNNSKDQTNILNTSESLAMIYSNISTASGTTNIDETDYPDDILDKAAVFALNLFHLGNATTKKVVTTTDDYTEMTNDLFDKIERLGVDLYNIALNVSNYDLNSSTPTFDVEKESVPSSGVNLYNIAPNVSNYDLNSSTPTINVEEETVPSSAPLFDVEEETPDSIVTVDEIKNNSSEQIAPTDIISHIDAFNETISSLNQTKNVVPASKPINMTINSDVPYRNSFPIKITANISKHSANLVTKNNDNTTMQARSKTADLRNVSTPKQKRRKRSLFSRCLKGFKYVGNVFRPVEKQIVTVLNDVFGIYSSSELDGDKNMKIKGRSHYNELSSDQVPNDHKHITSSSSKEDNTQHKDQISFEGSLSKKEENKGIKNVSKDSEKSKDNSLVKIKSENCLDTDEWDKSTTRKRTKKHKKKRKHKKKDFNSLFEDPTTVKLDTVEQNDAKDKNDNDQTLPDFIKNPTFGNNIPDYNDPQPTKSTSKDIKFGTQDYNDQQNLYGRSQPFGNHMGNKTFQDYNDQQNPYGRNQPFGNQLGNTFQDYNDQQNPYGENQPFANQMGNKTFQDYNEQQNPYGKNQPFANQMGNNTFQDYNDQQNPYGKNQPFANQIGNNTFQDYNDQQNPYGKNQPFGNQMGNTFQDYNDQQNLYGKNQPFANQMGNNTFKDYNDQQNPYGRNQPFANQMANNKFQDYNDQQNPNGRNQPFENQIGNKTFQDYNDQQIPYGNQPFENQIGNKTFQDYNDQQIPYGNQPFENQMGNKSFQDYNDPYVKNSPFGNKIPVDYNDQQNQNFKNEPLGNAIDNGTFPDYNNQQLSGYKINTNSANSNNAPLQSQNSIISPQLNQGTNQGMSNSRYSGPQNNIGPDDLNNGPEGQLNTATQGNYPISYQNARTNNNPGNQNPLGNNQQVNLTNTDTISNPGYSILESSSATNDIFTPKIVYDTTEFSSTTKYISFGGKNTDFNVSQTSKFPMPSSQQNITAAGINILQSNTSNFEFTNKLSEASLNSYYPLSNALIDTQFDAIQTAKVTMNDNITSYSTKASDIASNKSEVLVYDQITSNTNAFRNVSSKAIEEVTEESLKESEVKIGCGNHTEVFATLPPETCTDTVIITAEILEPTTVPIIESTIDDTTAKMLNSSLDSTQAVASKLTVDTITATSKSSTQVRMKTSVTDHTSENEIKMTSTTRQDEIAQQATSENRSKLEELLGQIYSSNSTIDIKSILQNLDLKYKGKTKTSDETSNTESLSTIKTDTSLNIQDLPEYITLKILGSPYILMKQDTQKSNLNDLENTGILNSQNSNLNAMNPFIQQPSVFNPYQNYYYPQPNFNIIPQSNVPFNPLPLQNPMLPNNIPFNSPDYQMPFNPFLEYNNASFPYGPYHQVYPQPGSQVAPPYPIPQPSVDF